MKRITHVLLLAIAVELLVGCIVHVRRSNRSEPPTPIDPDVAEQIRSKGGIGETAADWRQLGEWHMVAGYFADSELCHRRACDLDPTDATLARQWGFALERLARLDQANEQYRRAAELKPEWSDECEWFIGRNHLRAEKTAEARAAFARGIAFDPCRYELARLQRRGGESDAANDTFQALLAKQPGLLQVHHLGYRLATDRGDAAAATLHADAARYSTTKLTNPFDAEAARLVGVARDFGSSAKTKQVRKRIEEKNLAEAERIAREAGASHPLGGFEELLAEIAARRGDFSAAAKHLDEVEARAGPSARIAMKRGDVAAASGDQSRARTEWLRAAELGAGVSLKDVHHQLAASFRAAGNAAKADFHLARGHYFVGLELLKFGYAEKSLEYFVAAARHDANLADAWYQLAEARRRAGLNGPAAEADRECLKRNPDHGRAAAALGMP